MPHINPWNKVIKTLLEQYHINVFQQIEIVIKLLSDGNAEMPVVPDYEFQVELTKKCSFTKGVIIQNNAQQQEVPPIAVTPFFGGSKQINCLQKYSLFTKLYQCCNYCMPLCYL